MPTGRGGRRTEGGTMSDSARPQHDQPHVPAHEDDDDVAGHLMVRTDESITQEKDPKDASRRS